MPNGYDYGAPMRQFGQGLGQLATTLQQNREKRKLEQQKQEINDIFKRNMIPDVEWGKKYYETSVKPRLPQEKDWGFDEFKNVALKGNRMKPDRQKILSELYAKGYPETAMSVSDKWLTQDMVRKNAEQKKLPGTEPSAVREWRYYNKLTEAEKKEYLEMKRAEKTYFGDLAGKPSLIKPGVRGGKAEIETLASIKEVSEAKKQEPEYILKKGKDTRDWAALNNEIDNLSMELEKFDITKQEKVDKRKRRKEATALAGQTVVEDLQRGITIVDKNMNKIINASSGPIGGIVAALPLIGDATEAGQVENFIESVKSNISIDRLMDMKQNSETGGALGQIPVQQQEYLMSLLGKLKLSQKPRVLSDNMKRIYNVYMDIVHGEPLELRELQQKGIKVAPNKFFRHTLTFDELGNPAKARKWRGISEIIGSSQPQSTTGRRKATLEDF